MSSNPVTNLSARPARATVSRRARLVFSGLYVACAVVFFIGVAGFYRLLEDVDFVRVETPYGQS